MRPFAFAVSVAIGAGAVPTVVDAQIAGRAVPGPIYGVTFDNVSKPTAKTNALAQIVKMPTVRVVFDRGVNPSDYKVPIQQFRTAAYVMGELADSSEMDGYTVSSITTMTQNYTTTLGSLVDIWEIGNEINGDWLGSDAFAKMATIFNVVFGKGGKTALTFFYEGEANEPNNCIDSEGGMFPWISKYFQKSPTTQSEKIRLNLNYALISWYPSQCRGENPDWPAVYTKLASIFPNAKVGFGELGTPRKQNGSTYEKNLINTYYPMAKTTVGLPASYIGGYFWWYAAQEMVPWPGSLGNTLNDAINAGP